MGPFTVHRPHDIAQANGSSRRSRIPPGVGRTLRDARIVAGLPLADVKVQAGIENRYLRALEWERLDLLPGTAFARRAAQAEAQVLRLDPALIIEELERTHESPPRVLTCPLLSRPSLHRSTRHQGTTGVWDSARAKAWPGAGALCGSGWRRPHCSRADRRISRGQNAGVAIQ